MKATQDRPISQTPVNRLAPLPDRLWAKVNKTDTCWLWTGGTNRAVDGYGQIGLGSRKLYVHRLVYEWLVGPIPDGHQIDHLCMVPRCVNPEHLEAVTPSENQRRGYGPSVGAATQLARTHCRNGHEFTPENTKIIARSNSRLCRICDRAAQRRHYAKRQALAAEQGISVREARLTVTPKEHR